MEILLELTQEFKMAFTMAFKMATIFKYLKPYLVETKTMFLNLFPHTGNPMKLFVNCLNRHNKQNQGGIQDGHRFLVDHYVCNQKW